MKLIIGGATGFVGTEVLRQCLRLPAITSLIALSRKPFSLPENLEANSDVSKFKNVVIKDFMNYSEEEKKELSGADACIWTLAVVPSAVAKMPWEDVRRICYDYALVGLKTIFEVRNQNTGAKPFLHVYVSGAATERDPKKRPAILPEYCLMRGDLEVKILDFASEHKGEIEVCVAKPGKIVNTGFIGTAVSTVISGVNWPSIVVTEVSAALIHGALNGFEKDTLENADLVSIGQQALKDAPLA